MEKAKGIGVDALILDLEDAVAPDQKPQARDFIAVAVNAGGYGYREIVIRINALATAWGEDDLKVAARTRADAVCLPKVETAEQVRAVAAALDAFGAAPQMAIWAMIETPLAILNAREIASAHPRLKVFVMGTSDLAKDLRVPHTPDRLGFLTSLGMSVLAARAYGLDILDGVHLDLSGGPDFHAICEQGRKLGLRRQNADSSQSNCCGQRGVRTERGGDRTRAACHLNLGRGGKGGCRCRCSRRQAGRKFTCGRGAAGIGNRRGDCAIRRGLGAAISVFVSARIQAATAIKKS